ncbi:MAG: DMT family transporter [Synergistaceae bacterium]|nr:DMT family transporter [Synergistaceae bacterium]
MPLWGFILSFATATLWAASPIMVGRGFALSKCTSNEINPIRSISFFFASLIIALIYTGGHITVVTSAKALFLIMGNVLFGYIIGDILYFIAIREIGIGLAVPVSNSYPILVTLTSWLLLGEPVTITVLFGVTVVVGGLFFLRFGGRKQEPAPDISVGKLGMSRLMRGFLLAICAGGAWALGAPLTKLAMIESGLGAVEITFYRAAALVLLAWGYRFALHIFSPKSIMPLKDVPKAGWIYFLSAAVIGLCLGSIMYSSCIRVMPVAIVTAITSTSPFMAALFAHFVLKERLRPLQWCGVILIIAGSVTVSL